MADNTRLNVGSGGDLIATDSITDSGVANGSKTQRVKIGHGLDNNYSDANINTPLPVIFPSASGDAFGRFRVAPPKTLFNSKQIFDNQPQHWDEAYVSGSAGMATNHTTARASTIITYTTGSVSHYARQTFQRFNYESGKSQHIIMSGILTASGGGTHIKTAIGYFDDADGVYIQDDEGVLTVACRSSVSGSPVNVEVTQPNWNIDKLDGTGASGITLDKSKANAFVFDLEWLAVGVVRYGILQPSGSILYFHRIENANVHAAVYMSTPNLPCRYEIESLNTAGATSTIEAICTTVISEGGTGGLGVPHYESTTIAGHVDCDVDNTLYAVLGIKLKAAYIGTDIQTIGVHLIDIQANNEFEWLLIHNPTVASTFTYANITNSALQSAKGALANTVTIGSGAVVLAGGFGVSANRAGSAGGSVDSAIKLGSAIDGTVDELVLCCRPIGGSTSLDIEGGITWTETQ